MVENETNLKMKCLKFVNRGEYIDDDFKRYCAENEIKMTKTIPEKSQQNGVVGRMNMTLIKCARSMRIHTRFPETFWVNAVNTVTYLINKGLSIALDCRILEELQSGKKVNLSFFKVFGCLSYVHINAATISKFDSKSKKCFFIGYGDIKVGYHFWANQNRKIIKSKDVIFNEQVFYK